MFHLEFRAGSELFPTKLIDGSHHSQNSQKWYHMKSEKRDKLVKNKTVKTAQKGCAWTKRN